MTSVWPALCPPWKRTTISARSESQSTILPLPSSPHCEPTTTTFVIQLFLFPAENPRPAQTRASIKLCFSECDPVVLPDSAFYVTNQPNWRYSRSNPYKPAENRRRNVTNLQLIAYASLIVATLCWGGNAVAGKFAVDHVSPMLLTF